MYRKNKTYGGFISMEDPAGFENIFQTDIIFSTARSCLSYIIKHEKIKLIYLPYYICDVVIECIKKHKILIIYYEINDQFEIKTILSSIKSHDFLLIINYFGLKSNYITKLVKTFGKKLIVDNSQAFFAKKIEGVWSFNSARKFFSVVDGAFLYPPRNIKHKVINKEVANYNNDYLTQKKIGNNQYAYQKYLSHENNLDCNIKIISNDSKKRLLQLNLNLITNIRRTNFNFLNLKLGFMNKFKLNYIKEEVPLYYPLLINVMIRDKLIKKGVFIPQLWKEVLTRDKQNYQTEKYLAQYLICLPIDQRYNKKDMKIIYNIIRGVL